MFQDLSYNGPIEMTVAFMQNGAVLGEPSRSHSSPTIAAGEGYVVHFATVLPAQAAAGPAMVVVNLEYAGTITRASQEFSVSANPLFGLVAPDAPAPGMQVVSVTVAAGGFTVNSCVCGDVGCPDPTPGYASIPFPSAVLPLNGDTYITWLFQDASYTGPIEITVAFVQNGVVVGEPSHDGGVGIEAGFGYLMDTGMVVPPQASPGPATVVVSLSYGANTARASQAVTLQ
jgi:hypothetical protein